MFIHSIFSKFNIGNMVQISIYCYCEQSWLSTDYNLWLFFGIKLFCYILQNTGGGLFGNQKPGFFSNQNTGTGLFGSKPAGTTQPLSTGFGTTNPVPPFGSTPNTSAGGGLFGAQNTQNKTGMFSGFGKFCKNFAVDYSKEKYLNKICFISFLIRVFQ